MNSADSLDAGFDAAADPQANLAGEESGFHHIPVLSQELLQGLEISPGGHYLDATVGGGGHSRLILETYPDVQLTAIDRDAQALAAAQAELQIFGARVTFWRGNFADFTPLAANSALYDGILADLGVSSAQLDQPERGFSFRYDAPLDMRMDQRQTLTAADLLNTATETELADIFYQFGEERYSRRIARWVVTQRPLHTTAELAVLVKKCLGRNKVPRSQQGIHPATRVFQALRIAVNQELAGLETLLAQAPHWLKPGGRLGVISFHSLEDRRVKYGFREHALLQVITRKPIVAQPAELATNPRARSAKLRIAQRLASGT
jgi:16S rRNA (cytosine1402-N4)-methyltransferase